MKKIFSFSQIGSTLVEIMIMMVVLSTLFGLITINLLNTKQKANYNTTLFQLLSDIKTQQTKAMSLGIEGNASTTSDYGIHFESTSYTIFRGSTYTVSNTSNFVVNLGDNMQFSSITFPSSVLIFSRQSGEISSFNSSLNSIILKNSLNNEQKTIKINKYGVITQIN